MNLDNRIRKTLHEEANRIVPQPELKEKIISQITDKKGERNMKKRIVAGILAASLLIPTSAFAYQSLLADGLYGSFDNLKKHVASATMESYLLLNAKLSQAKGELGDEEYTEFKNRLSVITSAKIEYGDQYGNIDYDKLSPEKVAQMKEALMNVQPYFDRLNGEKLSKDVLTPQEYQQYIESLMTREKVLVQSGIDPSAGPIEVEKLPVKLQKEYQNAVEFMEYVSSKQR